MLINYARAKKKYSTRNHNINNNNIHNDQNDEGEILKQILGNSSENNFRSSMSFESHKYPYGSFVNNGNNSNLTTIKSQAFYAIWNI